MGKKPPYEYIIVPRPLFDFKLALERDQRLKDDAIDDTDSEDADSEDADSEDADSDDDEDRVDEDEEEEKDEYEEVNEYEEEEEEEEEEKEDDDTDPDELAYMQWRDANESTRGGELASKHPQHRWVMYRNAYMGYVDLRRLGEYADPNNMGMHIYTDWHSNGLLELIDNQVRHPSPRMTS